MPGNAVYLFLIDDRTAVLIRKTVAGFALRGNVGLAKAVVVDSLAGVYTI